MAKALDNNFYRSSEWLSVRDTYRTAHPLCEICLQQGIYTPADIVHHKKQLTAKNYKDASISLNPANLQSVCLKCHNQIHKKNNSKRRYEVLPNGEIIAIDLDEI